MPAKNDGKYAPTRKSYRSRWLSKSRATLQPLTLSKNDPSYHAEQPRLDLFRPGPFYPENTKTETKRIHQANQQPLLISPTNTRQAGNSSGLQLLQPRSKLHHTGKYSNAESSPSTSVQTRGTPPSATTATPSATTAAPSATSGPAQPPPKKGTRSNTRSCVPPRKWQTLRKSVRPTGMNSHAVGSEPHSRSATTPEQHATPPCETQQAE